jgi:hypothetical protein
MTARQFDLPIPAKAKFTLAHQPATPDTKVAHAATRDPRTGVVRAAGGVSRPTALAGALDRAGGGRFARAGSLLLQLQRQYGNREVQRVISRVRANAAGPHSQRGEVQWPAADPGGGAVDAVLQRTISAARDGGQPLGRRVSGRLGQALGTDFSHVRVHTDQRADRLGQAVHASAFTVGSDIFFRAHRYSPSTMEGERLLAHELTHVVQQGASNRAVSRVVPRLRLAPANDTYERVADRVADVVGGIRAHPPAHVGQDQPVGSADPVPAHGSWQRACPLGSPSIQRKVYIGKGRKQLEDPGEAEGGRQDEGTGERSMPKMIADEKSRYFKNEQEVYDYADEKTKTIGYVEQGQGAWIRLNDDELLVLGEKHPKEGRSRTDPAALVDIVKAVGTKRFKWELYTKLPPWIGKNAPMRQEMKERLAAKEKTFGITHLTGRSHGAESFFPKVWRGLAGLFNERDKPVGLKSEWELFQEAIRAVKAKGSAPALHKVYQDYQEALDLAESIKWGPTAQEQWVKKAMGPDKRDLAVESVLALQQAIAAYLTEPMEADPDQQKGFNKQWRPVKGDYSQDPDNPIMQAEKARDFSMYQHILQAAKNNYLLYGFGEVHGKRLKSLLKSHKGIKYMTIRDFIAQQRKKYPQD